MFIVLGAIHVAFIFQAHGDGGPLDEPIHDGYGLYFVGNKWRNERIPKTRLLRFDEDDSEFQRLNNVLWGLSEMHEDNVNQNLSLKDHLLSLGFKDSMIEMAAAGFANTLCSNIEELSLKQSVRWTRLWFQDADGDFKFKNSYACLINYLKSGLDIRTNKPVSSVNYQHATDPKTGKKLVQITTADGSVYLSRTAVFAISPHALGCGYIRFNPTLPRKKVEALSYTKMNKAMKVFIKFSAVCWPKNLIGTITANTETCFPEIWFRDCSDITLDRRQGVCYATAFVTSKYADRLCAMPEHEVYRKMVEQMDVMFSHLEPRHCVPLLNGDEKKVKVDLPRPSSVYLGGMMKKWTAEDHPFIGGGYCSPLAGCPVNSGDLIAAPVDNMLFFAGEAANLGPGATAHAALETGVRAASQVNQALRTGGKLHSKL
ncbi:hypothetical protein EON65_05410 [archaeon]|nr:MAG: hypothetical protein EON65_05410 [archaeon]